MTSDAEIETKFWRALKSDKTVMLGLAGVDGGHAQPMTAQLGESDGRGPIWFFTSKDVELVQAIGTGGAAMLHFVAKGHELFASVEGELVLDNDRETIDQLWTPSAAAWYEHGKDDPKLQLIRFNPNTAQLWLNANSMFIGMKMLLGVDPRQGRQNDVAEVRLD
jgi:general stress protein 26